MTKHFLLLVLAIAFIATAISPSYAECSCSEKEDPRTISVSGTGKLKATPDKATVRFSIKNLNKVPEKARLENTEISSEVLKAVRALGIPEKKIHFENLSIIEEFEYNGKNGTNQSKGYRANRSFSIEVEKPDLGTKTLAEKIAEVVAAVVSNGSNQLESVQYGLTNQDELNNTVLQMAIKNAKSKAEGLLASIGAQLGKARSINESYNEPYIRRTFAAPKMAMAMADSYAAETQAESFSEGDLELNATVNVVFEIL